MIPKPTLLLSPRESRDRNGPVAPTLTGGVLEVEGQYGPAWQVAEATENKLRQPTFSSIPYGGTTMGVTRDNVETYNGKPTLKVHINEADDNAQLSFGADNVGMVNGDVYTVSFKAKAVGGIGFTVYLYTPSLLSGGGLQIDSSEWKNYSITFPPIVEANNVLQLRLYHAISQGMTSGSDVWIAEPQLEKKPYSTPYADGSLGAGHAWTGTPNASSSTRARGSLTTANPINSKSGSALVRWRTGVVPRDTSNRFILKAGLFSPPTGTDSLQFYLNNGNLVLRWYSGDSAAQTLSLGSNISDHTDYLTYLEWDGTTARATHVDGTMMEMTRTEPHGSMDSTLFLGVYALTSNDSLYSNAPIESALFFDAPLTEAERTELMSMERRWSMSYWAPKMPVYTSGAGSFETEVYVTDRDNIARRDISDAVTGIGVNADVDRTGSKLAGNISTHRSVLEDGQWIAPYQNIIPEVGEILRKQMGHFKIATPSNEFNGSDMVRQDSSGGDIVDELARAILPETFYTPVRGHVMSDVSYLTKIATAGRIGPNLVSDGGFEDGGTGWTLTDNANGTFSFSTGVPAEGTYNLGFTMNAGLAVGSFLRAWQDVPIPQGATMMMISGIAYRNSSYHSVYLGVDFRDTDKVFVGNFPNANAGQVISGWSRAFSFAEVPEGAAYIRIYPTVSINAEPALSVSRWDDIQVRAITNKPIPSNRISLPPSTAIATSRIQTEAGKSYAYDAINPRLAAIGHTAIHTKMDGTLTTRPSRDAQNDTAARVYGEDDYRFVESVTIERSATNRYNHVIAIKEDMQEPSNSMSVNVYNEDRDDPWSIYGEMGLVSAPTLTVQDAVDEAALRTQALAVLARASMQEELTIRVLPDPDLAVFDVIEIIGGPEAARGRWSIESLEWGMSGSDPTVTVGARRTVRGGS